MEEFKNIESREDFESKEYFVKKLGELLSMTRDCVEYCRLIDENTVEITYKNGYVKHVNICCNSYLAIIKDVTKNI